MTNVMIRQVRRDEGFTLTELMMAVAVFSVVMAVVGGAMLGGFSAIRDVLGKTDSQAQVQNSAEWVTRLLRYMDIPEGGTVAMEEATATSTTFYSYSGTGTRPDAPYKVRLWTDAQPDGSRTLHSLVVTPTRTDTGWIWPAMTAANGTVRDLLTVEAGAGEPMSLQLKACNALTDCAETIRDVVLPVSGMPVLATGEVPYQVTVRLGDPRTPALQAVQQVRLVNLA